MRIVQVTHSFLPHIGGIENYVYALSKELIKKGHEVEVVTTDIYGSKSGTYNGIKITRNKSLVTLLRNPISISVFFEMLEKKDADILHIHNSWFITSLLSSISTMFSRKVLVLTQHGVYGVLPRSLYLKLIRDAYWPSHKWILRRSQAIIALSEKEKKFLMQTEPSIEEKVYVVPTGVETKVFDPNIVDDSDLEKKFNLENKDCLLFVGRLVPEKGPQFVIKALSYIKNRNPALYKNLVLLVVGYGPYLSELEKLANKFEVSDAVVFTGKLSFADLLRAYKSAKISVLPYSWEGIPFTVLESLAMETPVISNDVGGISEVVINGKTGYLLSNFNDHEEIGRRIIELLHVPDFLTKIGEQCRKTVLQNYDWEIVVEKIIQIYGSLAQR